MTDLFEDLGKAGEARTRSEEKAGRWWGAVRWYRPLWEVWVSL